MAQNKTTAFFKEKLLDFVTEQDPLLTMLEWLTKMMMQIEVEAKIGAEKGKHNQDRKTHFSGTRVRRFDSRLGTMYLVVPKVRKGGYVPFFVTERKRSEAALVQVIQESFINGVSTRRIERLAKSLGIDSMSASQVSEINKGLDAQVNEFRNRVLEEEYPVIWIDSLYQKIRKNGRVVNMAISVVMGVNNEGIRDILAVEPMWEESEASYSQLFKRLRERGLKKTKLIVTDAHAGLQKAIQKNYLGATWQRCKIHFMRNILSNINGKDKEVAGEWLKQIWKQPEKELALEQVKRFIGRFEKKYPKATETLEDGIEDSLQYFNFEELDYRKTSSTNILERLNKEVRRRSRVVGVFPSEESFLRLIVCYLLEYSEDWPTMRVYMSPNSLQNTMSNKKVT
jgi:putative transposase